MADKKITENDVETVFFRLSVNNWTYIPVSLLSGVKF